VPSLPPRCIGCLDDVDFALDTIGYSVYIIICIALAGGQLEGYLVGAGGDNGREVSASA
jgi:hypothetical protein